MNRDYAKRNSRKTAKKSQKSARRWPWIVLSLALLLYILWQFSGSYPPPGKFNLNLKNYLPAVLQKLSVETVKINKSVTSPKFEFYNVTPKNNEKETTTESYELVIGITNDFASADNLKAKLTLLGFPINILTIYQGGEKKYQVTAGPYNNPQDTVAMQRKLKAEGVKSKLKKSN